MHASPTLTAAQAARRSALVADVGYRIDLSLDAEAAEYSGSVVIEFTLSRATSDLSIDFRSGSVYSVQVNGTNRPVEYDGIRIVLQGKSLRTGRNQVTVHYAHPYSRDGAGLQRTRDPENGQVYVYSHCEPYDANRLFPCFDQPDLKATYRLAVSAPADWLVVAASSATSVTMMSPGSRDWEFAETGPFSTYLFALHAGPYTVWEARAGTIPLRLMARPGLADHVDADDWFRLTRRGFEFYEALFDIPYPFGKYDQLIVPDLNIGAMENVAAVTYNERYVTRSRPTVEQRQRHAEVLFHEMAHMWFGNLVTPRWWDGLWLKEAFATWASYLAIRETTDLDNPAQRFFAGSKQRGYREDEYNTRHPVDVEVEDTHVAFANFDAITYEKGAAVLTQLSHHVGIPAFVEGSRSYLKNNAWGSTTLADFVGAIEKAANVDLQPWMESWLRSAGVNTLVPQIECRAGTVAGLTLEQTAPGGTPLRTHRLQVALFDSDGDAEILPVSVAGGTTAIGAASGRPCPAMTLVNHGDWSFVRTALDPTTTGNFDDMIGSIRDPLARAMFWQSLWEMVRNAAHPLPAFVDVLARQVPAETDHLLLYQLTRSMRESRDLFLRISGPRSALARRVGELLGGSAWKALGAAPAGGERQKIWLEAFVTLASGNEYLDHLRALLDGHRKPAGLKVDADTRWQILQRLNAFAFGDFASRTDMEAIRDQSDRGRKGAIAANASRPDPDVKRAWMEGLLNQPDFMPLGHLRWGLRSLFPAHQEAMLEPFIEPLFASLERLGESRDNAVLRELTLLLPIACRRASSRQRDKAKVAAGSLHPILARALRNALEDVDRLAAVAELTAAPAA